MEEEEHLHQEPPECDRCERGNGGGGGDEVMRSMGVARDGNDEEGGEDEGAGPDRQGRTIGQLEAEVENPRTYMEWKEAALEKF